MQNEISFVIQAVYSGTVRSDSLFTHSLICTFLLILVFPLHTQHTVVSNNLLRRLYQSELFTNLTQNLKLFKFNVLPTTKMKKTITHETVLVNLTKLSYFIIIQSYRHNCRSQWPRGLRRRSTAAHLLRSWVRIPPRAWMFLCCSCCVLSGRGLCDGLIILS